MGRFKWECKSMVTSKFYANYIVSNVSIDISPFRWCTIDEDGNGGWPEPIHEVLVA